MAIGIIFQGAVGLECYSKRFIDIVNVVDVAIDEVFAFDDLDLSLATICEVFDKFALCVKGVPNRSDKVRFVMFGFMSWV